MQVTSAIDIPGTPVVHSGRSWARAAKDIRDGIAARELWGHLGWQDIKQRYRRSVIGPLWITMSMGVTAAGLGFLYSQLFGIEVTTFLPYLTVGFVVWGFIIGCLSEGSDTFMANEGLIKHLPAPLTVYALRTVWRQTLMLAHNLLVYVVVLALFFTSLTTAGYTLSPGGAPQPGLNWSVLMAIPAFALLALNGGWVTLLFGIISTRYRDIPQVINALTQLLFYITPIVWPVDILTTKLGPGDWKHLVLELNPLYHFIQILRAPLIGTTQSWHHWAVVGAITVVGWGFALLAMRNYRSRVSYWV
ncbi:ABC-2 type transport system permease protein [Actinokineospora globicatena]|uniref:Sugar ABC transporter permease n=1 Tax=Actinokineospora globicatena TaxID=103729 RepID=A0A9W6QIZ8_9PSEU|nr:ABC transporter permease [Actinokineospora globicatena]MCP2301093.1 ABC-2 type transport system permease protein [Actinokineospora globicatena]GLW91951.1 sugar ABC transporter permease [Actinokineospora globicatena]